MKRLPELRDLSEDHHHGLVLVRKTKQAVEAGTDAAVRETWGEVEKVFSAELEPHFQIEEKFIASILQKHGEQKLTERLYSDHKAIREAAILSGGRSAADLQRFGTLLEEHIRFEEREFFEVAQQRLSPEELRVVEEACRARRGVS